MQKELKKIMQPSASSLFTNARFQAKSKTEFTPAKRWGHTCCVLKDTAVLFGGELQQCQKDPIEPIYLLNLETYTFTEQATPGGPCQRDSHACVAIKDKVYIWGGCRLKQAFNDCYCYSMGAWKTVPQRGRIPCQRQSQLAVGLRDRWILLYGGYREKQKFRDFYIFDTEASSWFQLDRYELKGVQPIHASKVSATTSSQSNSASKISPTNLPPYRQNCTASVLQDSVYLFGGQNEEQFYCNDMYKVTLEHFNLQKRTQPPLLSISKVVCVGKPPSPRCSHSSIVYKQRYLIVMGGQRAVNTKQSQLLNDIWTFDFKNFTWQQINPKHQNLFTKRQSFTCVLYDTEIIIFGGLKDLDAATSLDDLLVLSLQPNNQIDTEDYSVCSRCNFPYKQRPLPKTEFFVASKPVSLRTLQSEMVANISQLIGHPFKAIGLILENYIHRSGVFFNISFKNKTFRFQSLNSVPFKANQVEAKLLQLNILSEQCETVTKDRNAKLAAFRLSAQFIIVCRLSGQTHFVLHTLKQKLHYCLADPNSWRQCLDPQFQPIRERLLLQNYTEDDFKAATQQVIAFNCQDLDTGINDIVVNDREMVNRALNARASLIEVSLRAYLSHYFLEWPTVTLWINNIPVELFSMKKVKNTHRETQFESIDTSLDLPQAKLIYRPGRPYNNILYYYRNSLVSLYRKKLCDQYSGFLLFPEDTPMNIFGNDLMNAMEKEFVEDKLQRILITHNSRNRGVRANIPQTTKDFEENIGSSIFSNK